MTVTFFFVSKTQLQNEMLWRDHPHLSGTVYPGWSDLKLMTELCVRTMAGHNIFCFYHLSYFCNNEFIYNYANIRYTV